MPWPLSRMKTKKQKQSFKESGHLQENNPCISLTWISFFVFPSLFHISKNQWKKCSGMRIKRKKVKLPQEIIYYGKSLVQNNMINISRTSDKSKNSKKKQMCSKNLIDKVN